ncbi:MAG TPA: hypothetical protein VLB45_01745, partial [Nitrosopumilaceae archaeon]|nr:hypothetical protein [Nitrosopumilaceae archaeon]
MIDIKIKLWQKFLLIAIILVLQPILVHAEESTGSVEINVKYTNGDRADEYGMVLKIYQDFNRTPYKEIESVSSNPYNITLPLGHKYTVEVYVNSMYSSVGYINLQKIQERLDISIPLSSGLRFNVFFKDGTTPMPGATVIVKSQDGKQWGERTTDDLGQTQRLWIQSTTKDSDYYVADIMLSDDIKYTYSPIKLTAGEKYESKIVTPWPAIIDELITVNIYKNTYTKIGPSDGKFIVELYNGNENKVTESLVNAKGEAHFSKIKVGTYTFAVMKLENNVRQEWNIKKITI